MRSRGRLRKSITGQLKVGVNRPSEEGRRLVGEGTRESRAGQLLVGEGTNGSKVGMALVKGLHLGQAYRPVLQVPPKPVGEEWTKTELDKWVGFAWCQSERRGPSLLSFPLQSPS